MQWSKLIGRTENLRWDPPILKFPIERHGGRMLGSTRAELQTWDIDVIHGTARIVATGHRQLEQMEARLDVKPLASETAAMIVDGRESPWLKWASPTRVRIIIAEVIPATNKQITAGRRKRFVAALDPLLGPQGWRRTKAGSHLVFERTTEG